MSCWCDDIIPLAVGLATIFIGAVVYNYLKKGNKKSDQSASYVEKSTPAPTKPAQSTTTPDDDTINPISAAGHPKTLVDPNEKYMLPLVEKEKLSHDSYRYRFGLPSKQHVLGLPIGQHIHLIATINEELVIRAYTPVSSDDDLGYVDLVIKVYHRNVNPKFPNGGKMSQYVDALKVGDTIAFKGPTGKLQYQGNGKFAIKKLRKDPPVPVVASTINMIAGGTGLTPMLQLAREILKKSNDKTRLALLLANQTENDILLRSELEDLAKSYPGQFKLWYTVDTAPEDWTYSKGFINEEMISTSLYPPSDDTIVLMCGPPPMINFACQPNLEKLGYAAHLRFAY